MTVSRAARAQADLHLRATCSSASSCAGWRWQIVELQ
jgi:hypothetical protein